MTPEGKLTKRITEYLKAKPHLWYLKIHGGPMQRAGIPDLLVICRGVWFFMEVKYGDNVPSKLQKYVMRLIALAGGECRVVWSVDDVRAVLRWAVEESKKRNWRKP